MATPTWPVAPTIPILGIVLVPFDRGSAARSEQLRVC
jgi:hypothetical protein